MKIINTELIDTISTNAKVNPRLRMNFNIHKSLEDSVHKLLNAMEPGTVIPIHRHKLSEECCVILRGRILLKFYNDDGGLRESIELDSTKGNYAVNIDAGEWHSLEVLESNTVIFEVKEGPYLPVQPDDILQPL